MMMKQLKPLFLLLIGGALVLGACFGGDEEPTPTPPPPTNTAAPADTPVPPPTDTPAPAATDTPVTVQDAQPASPLAAPDSPLATPVAVVAPAAAGPAPQAETSTTAGALTGTVLIRPSQGPVKPVADTKIALAEVVKGDDGIPRATGYDPINAHQTFSDSQGRFAINQIKPGLYGIIVDAVQTSVMLSDPETKESIIVEITADEVTDVGTLEYESLPLPGFISE